MEDINVLDFGINLLDDEIVCKDDAGTTNNSFMCGCSFNFLGFCGEVKTDDFLEIK